MPLNLNVPRTGSFPSQIPELPGNNTMVGPVAQCSRILSVFFWNSRREAACRG